MRPDEIDRAVAGSWLDEQVARHVMRWPEPALAHPDIPILKYSRDANRNRLVLEKIFDWSEERQGRFAEFLAQQLDPQLDDERHQWVLLLVHCSPELICKAALWALSQEPQHRR